MCPCYIGVLVCMLPGGAMLCVVYQAMLYCVIVNSLGQLVWSPAPWTVVPAFDSAESTWMPAIVSGDL